MSKLQFKQRIEEASQKNKTDIVLALDFPYKSLWDQKTVFTKAYDLLDSVGQFLCAVKVNHHLVLPLGLFPHVKSLVNLAHELGIQAIIDCKANDIGNTNKTIAEYYFDAGFDALIASPFVGWEEGLEPIFKIAQDRQKGVILLTYMSHKAAYEGYGQTIIDPQTTKPLPQYLSFARKALEWQADGAVVGATVPEKIREIYQELGRTVPIYSPGVGAQGGTAKEARKAGARFLIIGREITQAKEPAGAAKRMLPTER